MKEAYSNVIVQIVCSTMIPFIQLFGLYLVAHGHYSPGGGFQGGILLAVSIILLRLCLGRQVSYEKFPPGLGIVLGSGGILIFLIIGVIPMIAGGMFLDYAYLPLPSGTEAELRSLGILLVEVGITFAVFGTIVAIFDCLMGEL